MTDLMDGVPPFAGDRQVTLANWQRPPYNRWAFQHVRELVPTARIARAERASSLPRAERDLDALTFTSAGRRWTLAELLAGTHTDGFLVLHEGRVVTEQYFTGMRPDTPHLLMSVSKSVVATVAGILAGRGVLDVGAPVTDVVPQLRGTAFDGALVQHLLDMRAGVAFDENYDDPDADVRRYEAVYLWRPRDGTALPADALGYYPTLTAEGPHGGPFRYRSILTDVLGWVLERASGVRLHQLVEDELWRPMGAEFDAEISLDAHGNALADAGVSATLRDLARLGQLYLTGGGGVVPAAWVDDIVRGAPDGAEAFAAGDDPAHLPAGAHYRNCWWVRQPELPLYHATGINGQNVFVHVPARLVVVKLSTWPTPTDPDAYRATADAVHAIAAALS